MNRTARPAMILVTVTFACGAVPNDAFAAGRHVRQAAAFQTEKRHGPEFGFAYANRSGTSLLVPANGQAANRGWDRAVCQNGKRVAVRFAGEQKQGAHSTGRNTAANFEEGPGERFSVVDGQVPEDGACLLTRGAYLEGAAILAGEERRRPCTADVRAALPPLHRRAAVDCRTIAGFSGGLHLLAVEYVPPGRDRVPAFVVLDGSSAYVEELPPKRGGSSWRVDDGGRFRAESVTARFTLKKKDGTVLMFVEWAAAEGDDLLLLGTSAGGRLRPQVRGYRYTAPI